MISTKKQFIFVHIPKTAGSSVAWALRKHFDKPSPAQRMIMSISKRLSGRSPYTQSDFQPLDVHANAARYLQLLGDKFWEMRSIAFVRNPFDLQVSLYHYIIQTPAHPAHERIKRLSFGEFLHRTCSNKRKTASQTSYLVDENGKNLVSHIGRFETLADDFYRFCNHLGVYAKLDHINSSTRKKSFVTLYSPELVEMVVDKFRCDFDNFGYSTDPTCTEFGPIKLERHPKLAD